MTGCAGVRPQSDGRGQAEPVNACRGLSINGHLAHCVAHQWEAAHNFEQAQLGTNADAVPTLVSRSDDPPSRVLEWVRRHPNAIISRSDHGYQTLRAAGVRIPAEMGYVSLNVSDDAPGVSGMLQPRDVMGAAAVDALNALLLVSHRGPGASSLGTHVDGVWYEGRTVRPAFATGTRA